MNFFAKLELGQNGRIWRQVRTYTIIDGLQHSGQAQSDGHMVDEAEMFCKQSNVDFLRVTPQLDEVMAFSSINDTQITGVISKAEELMFDNNEGENGLRDRIAAMLELGLSWLHRQLPFTQKNHKLQ